MNDYMVVREDDIYKLTDTVKELLDDGWEVSGGVGIEAVGTYRGDKVYFYQALIKNERVYKNGEEV